MFQENIKIQKLLYDYYNTPIYLNQYEKNTIMNGFIKLPFINANSLKEPNLYTSNNNYIIQNLYIFKNIHNINNIDYDGELVIEHIPNTNNEQKVYTVFLLKTNSGSLENNDIDTIIYNAGINNPKKKVNLNLNTILSQTMINADTPKNTPIYQHKNVYVFIKPIYVNSQFINFSDDILNSPFPKYKKYEIVVNGEQYYTNNISFKSIFGGEDSIKEGLSFTTSDGNKENVFIDCKPIDDSDVDKNVQYVPITTDNNNTLNIFTLSILSIIIMFSTFFPIKMLYEYLFKILEEKQYNRANIEYIIYFIISIFLFLGIYILVVFEYSNITLLMGGFIILLSFISVFIIYINTLLGEVKLPVLNTKTIIDLFQTIINISKKNYSYPLYIIIWFFVFYVSLVYFFGMIYSTASNEKKKYNNSFYSISRVWNNPFNFSGILWIASLALVMVYLIFIEDPNNTDNKSKSWIFNNTFGRYKTSSSTTS
jgi:hypothetical protein